MIKNITLILTSVLISLVLTLFVTKEFSKDLQQKAKQPRIITIDSHELFKEFVMAISASIDSNTQEEIQEKITTHKIAVDLFNSQIVKIARDNNLIILDKNSVISGAEDQTSKAKLLLRQLMRGVEDE